MGIMTPEEAQKLSYIATAVKAIGSDAAQMAEAQDIMRTAADNSADPEAYKNFASGAFEGSLTAHSTLVGLLAVEAEAIRDRA